MKKYLVMIGLVLLFTMPVMAQVNEKKIIKNICVGVIDTIKGYDTLHKKEFTIKITTKPLIIHNKKVSFVNFDLIDTIQKIVICEGIYDSSSVYIEGTRGRYFSYEDKKRFPFEKMSKTKINQMKKHKN